MPIKEWAARIVSMMGDRDPGVVLTVTALVTTMAQAEIEAFSGSYQKAVDILDRVGCMFPIGDWQYLIFVQIVFEGHYPAEYIYYKVPNPWLQIRLLRLLQYYPPPGTRSSFPFGNPADNSVDNPQVVEMVNAIIQAIIDSSQDTPRVSFSLRV